MSVDHTDRIILGIDPGTHVMGFGVIAIRSRKFHLVDVGSIQITSAFEHIDKLKMVYERVNALITRLQPDECAIESPFYGKNVQSMLKLGRAQGVSIAAALNAGLPVSEYSPKKVKKAITGNGNASKEQVSALLPHFVGNLPLQINLDATDALAVAICHALQNDLSSGLQRYRDWKSFAQQNKNRIR